MDAYALGTAGPWSAATALLLATAVLLAAGGLWSLAMPVREVVRSRARRRARRAELLVSAPLLSGEEPGSGRFVVLEGGRPDA